MTSLSSDFSGDPSDHLTGESLAGALYRAAGDSAFVIEFGDSIHSALLARVSQLDLRIRTLSATGDLPGLIECVPTFRSLAVLFDPLVTHPAEMLAIIGRSTPVDPHAASVSDDSKTSDADSSGAVAATADTELSDGQLTDVRSWSLPVLYGGAHGPDLEELARSADLSPDEIIARHEDTPLAVYMLGFLPGFAFLGDIDKALRQPRRESPRTRVPAGSVAVANALSAVYPWESPGGWHLIGHCPVPLFDASRDSPTLLHANDRVSFHRVSPSEHAQLVSDLAAPIPDTQRFLHV